MPTTPLEPLASRSEERRFLLKLLATVVFIVLLLLAVLSWRGATTSSAFPRVQLSDGTWLVARAVTVGKNHAFEMPYPRAVQYSRWQRNYTKSTVTPRDRMLIWLTRENDKGEPLDMKWFFRSELVLSEDFMIPPSSLHTDHQERYGSSGSGTGGSGFGDAVKLGGKKQKQDAAVAHCEFPLVRPRPGVMSLNIYDGTKSVVAVLEIPYPKLPKEPDDDWQFETLPSTKSVGNLEVTLKKVEFRRGSYNMGMLSANPILEFRHDGEPSQTWFYSAKLLDAIGNESNAYQCELSPFEPVWKLQLTLQQHARGRFLPEEQGKLPTLPLSPDKQLVLHSGRYDINGTEIRIVGVGGKGPMNFTLPNSNYAFKTRAYEPGQQSTGMTSGCSGNKCDVEFYSGLPFLITATDAATDGNSVQLAGRDQDGAEILMRGGNTTDGLTFWFFDPPETSTSITFEVIVQKQRQVEFFIAPPKPEEIITQQ